jgi:hypothetical protein
MAAFDGGIITSDAGALLLGATNRAIGQIERFATCRRDPRLIQRLPIATRPASQPPRPAASSSATRSWRLRTSLPPSPAPKRSRRFCRAWRSIGAKGGGHLEWPPNCNSDRAPLVCEDRAPGPRASGRLTAFGRGPHRERVNAGLPRGRARRRRDQARPCRGAALRPLIQASQTNSGTAEPGKPLIPSHDATVPRA